MTDPPILADSAAHVARWATMFDAAAPSYDQSGVPFFGTIAAGLVQHLAPSTGERALDIGAGRGALTFGLAEGVGTTGRVDAIDISPVMVELTTRASRARELPQVNVSVADASDPPGEPSSYDLVASSLVVFFLPEPGLALRRWRSLLSPGGRLGISTFRPWPTIWQSIEDVFTDYIEATEGPGPTDMPDLFDTDDAVAEMVGGAGFHDVHTEVATYAIPFLDTEQWRIWSMGTAMRGLWMLSPADSHPEILHRVGEILDGTRGEDGLRRLDVSIRYTLGVA